MKRIKYSAAILFFISVILLSFNAQAYVVPEEDSQIKYFYVFGQSGNPDYGAESDHELSFFIDLPEDAPAGLSIDIFDPDTGYNIDSKEGFGKTWDTVVEFMLFGRNNILLDSMRFADDKEYDRKYFKFGPYLKNQGEKIVNKYRFKLNVKALKGSNANLFSLRVSPESAEIFTYKAAFRLLEEPGSKMYLYPEITKGTTKISIENYDMDVNGGKSLLYDALTNKFYRVNDSGSALWSSTLINLPPGKTRRLQYIITKGSQRNAQAAVQFKDDLGRALPVYFREGKYTVLPEVINSDCRNFTFDATESYDPNEQGLSYLWDFGDGSRSTQPIVKHKYEKAGTYTAVLYVKNTTGLKCNQATTSQIVTVNSPPQASFSGPEIICYNEEAFFDASLTTDNTPEQLSYEWDFGDGTGAEGKKVKKRYAQGGVYRVILTVNDNAKTSCSISRAERILTVNTPFVLGSYEDIDLCVPLDQEYKVAFNFIERENQLRANLNYLWDFGDGGQANGRNVSHIYKNGGEYMVRLTVDDGLGLPCSTANTTFYVRLNRQPQAEAGKDITACLGKEIILDGSASRGEELSSLSYTWSFGDGTPDVQGAKVKHTYMTAGKYKATITVHDSKSRNCSVSTDSVSVLVNTKPELVLRQIKGACIGKNINFAVFLNFSKDPYFKDNTLVYTWDFGDGAVIKGPAAVNHTYKKGAEYLVKVMADDQLGTDCSISTQSMLVKVNTPPVADTGPNLVCCANVESIFDGSSSYDPDGDTLTYFWDFGDGQTASGAQVTHVFKKRGKYKVLLRVEDDSGTECNSSTDRLEVSVSEKPVSKMKVY
jgi:PKD repeat protein